MATSRYTIKDVPEAAEVRSLMFALGDGRAVEITGDELKQGVFVDPDNSPQDKVLASALDSHPLLTKKSAKDEDARNHGLPEHLVSAQKAVAIEAALAGDAGVHASTTHEADNVGEVNSPARNPNVKLDGKE